MLSDFLLLEKVFAEQGRAVFIDELIAHYGEESVTRAMNRGYINVRRVCLGPDCGRNLCWLSDEGRCEAMSASCH